MCVASIHITSRTFLIDMRFMCKDKNPFNKNALRKKPAKQKGRNILKSKETNCLEAIPQFASGRDQKTLRKE